jgi:ketosteroid isomerase-like protein
LSEVDTSSMHPVMTRQLECLAALDLDGLMQNYTDDATLIRFDATASGIDQLREGFREYLAMKPEIVELTAYTQTDDVIFYHATMKLNGQPEDSVGTLVLRDGKIWRQTAHFAG